MSNQWKYLFGLLFLFLLACNRAGEHEALFRLVESVVAERPDSAMVLLKRVENPALLSREEMARYYLLWTEAADKAYVEHTTDSLITIATDYYEETDDLTRRAKAWYYRGRINQDLARPLKAQEYYLKALRDEEQIGDYALLGRIHNHIGTLYTYQEVYDKALPHQKEAVENFRLLGDSTGQVFALRDLSRVFLMLGRQDSAMLCDEKAISLMSKRVVLSTYTELASLYMAEQRMDEARELLRTVLRNKAVRPTTKYPAYLVLGELLKQCGQLDSARYYLQACVDSALSSETRAGGLYYLKEIAFEHKRWEEAATLARRYEILCDSIRMEQRSESIRKYQALYDYQEAERQLAIAQAHTARNERNFILAVGFCAVVLAVMFYYRKKVQLQKEKAYEDQKSLADYRDRLAMNERVMRSLEEDNKQKTSMYLLLEKDNMDLRERIHRLETRPSGNSFINSTLCAKFQSKGTWKPEPEDWEALFREIDRLYPSFTCALDRDLPGLGFQERRLCYLVKIGVKPGVIARLLCCSDSAVSMYRKRLYEKATGQSGSAKDFDRYISEL